MNNKNGENNGVNEQQPSPPTEPFGGLAPGIVSSSETDDDKKDARSARRRIFATILICIIIILLGLRTFSTNMPQSEEKKSGVANQTKTDPNRAVTIELPLSDLNQQGVVAGNTGEFILKNGLIFLPTIEPANPKPGEVYYNLNTNILNYFNGTKWIEIEEQLQNRTLTTIIQGSQTTEYINNTSTTNTTENNSSTVYTAGSGITITDQEISNSGILQIGGTPNQVLVSTTNGTTSLSLPQDIATTSSPTFQSLQLTTPLSVLYGGTGVTTIPTNGVVIGNGTNGVTTATASGAGQCLLSTAGAPVFGACPGGGGGSPDTLQSAYDNSSSPATITTSSAAKSVIIKAGAGSDSTNLLQVQNAASVDVLTVDTTNSQLEVRGINSDGVVGSELVTSQAFNNPTYWTCSPGWTTTATTATHTTGNTNTCAATPTNFPVSAGTTYKINFNLALNSNPANTITPSIGGVSSAPIGETGNGFSTVITAASNSPLTFTPSSNYNGRISGVSVKAITASNAVLQVKNSSGTVGLEVRTGSDTSNSFIGLQAGSFNADGVNNTAVGSQALYSNTSGDDNTALGTQTLQQNNGHGNTAIGSQTLHSNTIGGYNSGVGEYSLYSNTTGRENAALGAETLFSNTTGVQNSALGAYALYSNATGSYNVALGDYALTSNSSGVSNIAVGSGALYSLVSGGWNTAIGADALGSVTTGSGSTAVGAQALFNNTTGVQNTALGYQTLNSNSDGYDNIAVGYQALKLNTSGPWNTAVGNLALENNTIGGDNIAVGQWALRNNTEGNHNTATGVQALQLNTDAEYSTAFGFNALRNSNGYENTGVGGYALYNNFTGQYNTAIGYFAGHQDPNTDWFNTSDNLQNATMVGYGATSQMSNSLILGAVGTVANNLTPNVGIGTTSPTNLLSVSPIIYDTGTARTTASSTVIGIGTSWNANMVGMEFVFSNGDKYTITGFTNATTMTLSASSTHIAQGYRIHNPSFNVSRTGSITQRTSTNSTTAYQLQNAAGSTLLSADTSGMEIKVSGTTGTFARFTIENAHFKSTQTTSPTIGMGTCVGSPAITAGSTDSAGSFTTGNITTGGNCSITVTFNKAYGAAPKSVIITPSTATASSKDAYISLVSTTAFTATFAVGAGAGETDSFNYWVVE